MALLSARNIHKQYTIEDRTIPVLHDISLDIEQGAFVVISGSSGSGKTTLLTLLSGLDQPTSGEIDIDDVAIHAASEAQLAPLRLSTIGFVFQSFHLVPSMTALENVMFPAELAGDRKAAQRAHRLIEGVGMAHRSDNLPSQLSGGEKQRIALCRAMINRPKLLFADEPTGNLDSKTGRQIIDLLFDVRDRTGASLVLVTHEQRLAERGDRMIRIDRGRIVEGP